MTTRSLVVAVAATASLAALAGCGGQDPTSSASGSRRGPDAATKKAMLEFAQCMREHGVDMPDPQFSGGRVTMQQVGGGSPRQMRAAENACRKYMDKIKPPATSANDREKFKQQALANARCMRAHGITNFPDPTFDANGGVQLKLDKGGGIDPNDPKFQAAQKACAKVGGIGTTSVGAK